MSFDSAFILRDELIPGRGRGRLDHIQDRLTDSEDKGRQFQQEAWEGERRIAVGVRRRKAAEQRDECVDGEERVE